MADMKFEEALSRLEEIVKKMEQGEMTLEESLKAFEEGVRLSRLCARRLDDAERKVNKLLKTEEGITEKPYTGDTEDTQ